MTDRQGDAPKIRKLTYANVVATLALFLALGGAAVAVVGGGDTLVSTHKEGISSTEYETLDSVFGVGDLKAKCTPGSTAKEFTPRQVKHGPRASIALRFRNRSGRNLLLSNDDGGSDPAEYFVPKRSTQGISTSRVDALIIRVFPRGDHGSPVATFFVSTDANSIFCHGVHVAVQPLSDER